MKFNVVFRTPNNEQILEKMGEQGLDILDDIRDSFPQYDDVKTCNLGIDTSCPINSNTYNIIISEKMARTSKLFAGRTEVVVKVPEYGLSRFSRFDDRPHTKEVCVENGFKVAGISIKDPVYKNEVVNVEFKIRVNPVEVVEAWAEQGFPLVWEPNKDIR